MVILLSIMDGLLINLRCTVVTEYCFVGMEFEGVGPVDHIEDNEVRYR